MKLGTDLMGCELVAKPEGLYIETWYEAGTSWSDTIPWSVIDQVRAETWEGGPTP